MPQRFEIKVEIELNDEKKYYPGDKIQGKILLTSNQSHTLQKLWLAWTGRIQVQPKENERASNNYFDECWKLCSPIYKSPYKLSKGGPIYQTDFVPFSEEDDQTAEYPVLLELSKNKTVGFFFEVKVPDIPLPSSTGNGFAAHRIVYFLEAFTGTIDVFYRQKVVPVYQMLDMSRPEMMVPQRMERMYSVLTTDNKQCSASMQVIVPCLGHVPGTTIPISITIHSDAEISRKQGISVSLLRTHEVLVNDRTFSSFVEPISRSVQDLQLVSNKGNITQIVQVMLHIPKDTVPTISTDQSKIMSVNYYVRTLVYAHQGTYISQDYQESQFLSAEMSFIIGTLKETPSPSTSPTLSISGKPIGSSSAVSMASKNNSNLPAPRTSSSTKTTEDSSRNEAEANKKLSVGSLFRRTSGKTSGEDKPVKKKNIMSSLWPGRRKPKVEQERMEETTDDENKSIREESRISSKGSQITKDENRPITHEDRNTASTVESEEAKEIQTEGVIRHQPFLDSDSDEEVEQTEAAKMLEGMRLNKPDEIIQRQIKLEKPHLKDKTM